MRDFTLNLLLEEVWEKAVSIPGLDPAHFRRDEQGSLIRKADFNNEGSIYGWCFDHVRPLWEGGESKAGNVIPLNCTNKMISLAGHINDWRRESDFWD